MDLVHVSMNLVSMDQVSMDQVSVDQISRYLGTKVPRYLAHFIRTYFAMARAVAKCLIVIHATLNFLKSLPTILLVSIESEISY